MILETIIAALVPVAAEGMKQGVAKLFGGVRAASIEEQIKLDNNEIEKIKALATLDTPIGNPSQWVIDFRTASRYIAAWACIVIGAWMLSDALLANSGQELISIAFGFLFGTRIVSNWNAKN